MLRPDSEQRCERGPLHPLRREARGGDPDAYPFDRIATCPLRGIADLAR